MNLEYDMIGGTDTGWVRSTNEDCFEMLPGGISLAVVADGLGGHQAGEVASRMAVDAVCEHFATRLPRGVPHHDILRDVMIDAMSLANRRVYEASHQRPKWAGMGTTLLAAYFQPDYVHVGHVGDSRLYSFRKGKLVQLTTDHTLASELLSANPDLEPPASSHHQLQKAVGVDIACRPDFLSFPLRKKESYLLCTDGLSDLLDHGEIADILTRYEQYPERCVDTLLDTCMDQGAPDNVSLILVFRMY